MTGKQRKRLMRVMRRDGCKVRIVKGKGIRRWTGKRIEITRDWLCYLTHEYAHWIVGSWLDLAHLPDYGTNPGAGGTGKVKTACYGTWTADQIEMMTLMVEKGIIQGMGLKRHPWRDRA